MWCAICESRLSLGSSVRMKIKSNRDMSAGERLICWAMFSYLSNLPNLGLAAARSAHLDLRVAMTPALATLMVCCSIASCNALRSSFLILSISSMHAMPLSARTKAPASMVQRPSPNSSFTAVAVRPADEELLPEVYIPRGDSMVIYLKSWLLAIPGSPTKRI